MTKKSIQEIAELQRASLPVIHQPFECESQEAYLRTLVIEGANAKYGAPLPDNVEERIVEELNVITSIKATNGFLFHHYIVKVAKDKLNVLFGPGRGSAAGSIVCYCLGLTSIDPLENGLLWERFFDSNRFEMPDIDFDVDEEGRKCLIDWLKEEYGEEYVAHISTNEGKGIHLSGIVVTDNPVREYMPIIYRKDPDNDNTPTLCTEHDALTLHDDGLYKIDLIVADVLSDIKKIISHIQAKHDITINLDEIPTDDNKVFQLFSEGNTSDIFYFESDGLRKFLQKLQPTKFKELVAISALYRPGPLDLIPEYIARKHSAVKQIYDFPFEEKYLSETYGLLVYQEQLMQIAQDVAGFTKESGEALRKALQNRKESDIDKLSTKFKKGAQCNGFSHEETEHIWNKYFDFEDVAFLFNKSHTVCYSWIGYQCAYLKTHYPEEYNVVMSVRNEK